MMPRIEPLIPGVRNPLDICLGWISEYRRKWEKRLAREEAQRADTEWLTQYVATMALTMQAADRAARDAACAEITDVMRDAGLWPPAESKPD